LTKVYERVIRKYQQVDQGIKSINRHIKLIIATIPPTDLNQTLLKHPHKSEKIETITCDHQTSYENFVCRVNEEFINMFNNNETEVHLFHILLSILVQFYHKYFPGYHSLLRSRIQ
jgi:hypothetical protein